MADKTPYIVPADANDVSAFEASFALAFAQQFAVAIGSNKASRSVLAAIGRCAPDGLLQFIICGIAKYEAFPAFANDKDLAAASDRDG